MLGLLCGILARLGAWAITHAKRVAAATPARIPLIVVGSMSLAAIAYLGFDDPVHLAIGWTDHADHTLLALCALFAIRAIATWIAVGGGVGGLSIPLVTQGAIAGSIVQQILPASNEHLLPTVGIAAFLARDTAPRPPASRSSLKRPVSQASSSPHCLRRPLRSWSWAAGPSVRISTASVRLVAERFTPRSHSGNSLDTPRAYRADQVSREVWSAQTLVRAQGDPCPCPVLSS